MRRESPDRRRHRLLVDAAAVAVVWASFVTSLSLLVRSAGRTGAPAPVARVGEPAIGPIGGALRGLPALGRDPAVAERQRLVAAADAVVARRPHARRVLLVTETDGPFVVDAQAAWTLALAGHVTRNRAYRAAAVRLVQAWVGTARAVEGACPDSGSCTTSLMVSRAAPALVFAVDVLVADQQLGAADVQAFHRWLRTVVLPAASDRDNNWGDAGTYLRAVVGAELGDRAILRSAARRWAERLDLVGPDGTIPEELRRGRASLMYSQEALGYKVATADVLARSGLDVWHLRGRRGGTLDAALALTADGLVRPSSWPVHHRGLRVPRPAALWAIAAARSSPAVGARAEALAGRALASDGAGHSAVLWTSITHPVTR